MILRALVRLVGLFVILVVGFLVARVLRSAGRAVKNMPTGTQEPRGVRTAMVRDRVCNTFLPRSRALARTVAGQEHFFCSEGCLRAFLERKVASGSV